MPGPHHRLLSLASLSLASLAIAAPPPPSAGEGWTDLFNGADLTGSYLDARTVRLVLHIPDQACAECIMPATHLIPIFEMRAAEHLGPGVQIELDDPRLQH